MKLFISPHNDDETLFGALTLLRERPHVVIVLRSHLQEHRGRGITYAQREAETAAAMEILGCTWEQWEFSDAAPDWRAIESRLIAHEPEDVWYPRSEMEGHAQHNRIGDIASSIWPYGTRYCTYTTQGKSIGREVHFEHGWVELKLRALACYKSQINEASCCEHFIRDQREYYAP